MFVRHLFLCSMVLFAFAGCDDGEGGDYCAVYAWEPDEGDSSSWPTMEYLVEDPTTDTGYRFSITVEEFPELADLGGYAAVATEDLNRLDGFGVVAGAFLGFEGPFDPVAMPAPRPDGDPDPDAGIGYVVLPESEDPYLIAAETQLTDEGRSIVLRPLFPLPEQSRVGVYATRALESATAAGCIEPSLGMAALLAAPGDDRSEAIAALTSLGVIADAADLVALHVVPTQTITRDSVAVADTIDGLPDGDFGLSNVSCMTEVDYRSCTAELTVSDFRDDNREVPPALMGTALPQSTYTLPVHIWLPLESVALPPYPTVLYGHGLTGSGSQGSFVAKRVAALGYATVAVSAVQHGDHPSVLSSGRSSNEILLDFFALNFATLSTDPIDAFELRDNFRQTTYDRLQVTRMLETEPDLVGDATPEIDANNMVYVGISLGGIMGNELVALTDAYGAAALVVPGGRVTTMLADPDTTFSDFLGLVAPNLSQTQLDRFFPMLQAAIDAGDAASYARHVAGDRLRDSATPSVLMQVALDDATIPNSASWILARAMGTAIVPEHLRDVPGLASLPGLPVSGNLIADAQTMGLVQYDVVDEGMAVVPATHGGVASSEVGSVLWSHFIETHLETGAAEIIDTFALLGIDHGL